MTGQPHSPCGAEVRREKPSTEREVDLCNEAPPSDADSPRCGSTLRLIAAIEDPTVARKILECLKLPAARPRSSPQRLTPQDLGHAGDDWLFDQTPVDDEP